MDHSQHACTMRSSSSHSLFPSKSPQQLIHFLSLILILTLTSYHSSLTVHALSPYISPNLPPNNWISATYILYSDTTCTNAISTDANVSFTQTHINVRSSNPNTCLTNVSSTDCFAMTTPYGQQCQLAALTCSATTTTNSNTNTISVSAAMYCYPGGGHVDLCPTPSVTFIANTNVINGSVCMSSSLSNYNASARVYCNLNEINAASSSCTSMMHLLYMLLLLMTWHTITGIVLP